jgi:predicted Fe-S protein YdhL (DUF1289 family)
MSDDARGRPQSPCTKICTLDQAGLCIGCLRTVAEIASWISMSSDAQWQLLGVLEERRRRRVPPEP